MPDAAPFVFAIVQSGPVEIFLNAPEPAIAEYPAFKDRPIGGTLTLFIEVADIARVHKRSTGTSDRDAARAKWYGVTEFAFADPDGYLITIASGEPVKARVDTRFRNVRRDLCTVTRSA